jgi:hypothetical protein
LAEKSLRQIHTSLHKKASITADQEEVHHQPSGKFAGLVWSFGLNNPLIQVQPIFNQSQSDIWHLLIFEHPHFGDSTGELSSTLLCELDLQ